MAKSYEVSIDFTGTYVITVEADCRDEAEAKALRMLHVHVSHPNIDSLNEDYISADCLGGAKL